MKLTPKAASFVAQLPKGRWLDVPYGTPHQTLMACLERNLIQHRKSAHDTTPAKTQDEFQFGEIRKP